MIFKTMGNIKKTIILILVLLLASGASADASSEAVKGIQNVICKFICLAEMSVGAIAALMIIFAGLRYVTAGRESSDAYGAG
jgi:hypothetical protein